MRFLIVDDNDDFRRVMRRAVERLGGLEVMSEARTGEEALEKIGLGGIDAVLMDVEMPRLDGISAVRLLRESHGELPVLMCSSSGPAVEQACLDAGATCFAPKESLLAGLDELLDRLGFTRG